MLEQLESLRERALQDVAASQDAKTLDDVRVRVLGRSGELTAILRNLKDVDPELRPAVGQRANEVKGELQAAIESMQKELASHAGDGPKIDLTLPGRRPPRGHLHVLTQTRIAMERVLVQMGYQRATGPQIETDYYNFEALNLPADHPARDMQDTFYIEGGLLLRTHTSPVQIRTMEQMQPPIRIIAPGITFRRDDDATHSPQFMQVEGLVIDKGVTFGDLKGTVALFVQAMFGPEIGVRFRPSFFPFTEPSAEIDMQCTSCGGTGCRTCAQTGWLEIGGCGMVDPAVFTFVDYDPEIYTGFAFGMGIERIAMIRHAIDDMRLLYENNLQFLEQF